MLYRQKPAGQQKQKTATHEYEAKWQRETYSKFKPKLLA